MWDGNDGIGQRRYVCQCMVRTCSWVPTSSVRIDGCRIQDFQATFPLQALEVLLCISLSLYIHSSSFNNNFRYFSHNRHNMSQPLWLWDILDQSPYLQHPWSIRLSLIHCSISCNIVQDPSIWFYIIHHWYPWIIARVSLESLYPSVTRRPTSRCQDLPCDP